VDALVGLNDDDGCGGSVDDDDADASGGGRPADSTDADGGTGGGESSGASCGVSRRQDWDSLFREVIFTLAALNDDAGILAKMTSLAILLPVGGLFSSSFER
jgi:hypothetical protein